MKDPLIFALITLAVVVAVLLLVYLDPSTERRDRVDVLSLGPWVVEKLEDQVPVFLCFESVHEEFRQSWSSLLADAWRYGDKEIAEIDAEKVDGVARSIKAVVAEAVQ